MQRRLIRHLVSFVLVLIILYITLPTGREAVYKMPMPEKFDTQKNCIWVWDMRIQEIIVNRGSSVIWGLGWESQSQDALRELKEDLEIEFYINSRKINAPERFFAFRRIRTGNVEYLHQLRFIYESESLPPGEHVWTIRLGGSVRQAEFSGIMYVSEDYSP